MYVPIYLSIRRSVYLSIYRTHPATCMYSFLPILLSLYTYTHIYVHVFLLHLGACEVVSKAGDQLVELCADWIRSLWLLSMLWCHMVPYF